MPKTNIIFSPTSFDTWQICKAKYKFSNLLKKTVPISERGKGLDYGSLTHKGLEIYYKGIGEGKHFNDRVHELTETVQLSASDINQSNIDITSELPVLLNSLTEYCEYYRFTDDNLEILGVEEPFDFILYEDDFVRVILSGKIDLRVNIPPIPGQSEYKNLPFDHKSYQRSFPVDRSSNQFITYAIATGSNYLMYNGIGLQKTLPPPEKFRRIPLSYDPLYLEQWKEDTIKEILTFFLPAMINDHFPVNFNSCRKFGKLCEFHRICDASGKEARIFNLDSFFVDREEWDKYKVNEE